ncbi:MAG: hypothetical protein HQL87_03110 [Magnetococcales bacterium]|nr:hypothetical protein [Magnetococcales bacterium]
MSAIIHSPRLPGRPPKSRTLNGSADTANGRWTVRGVPSHAREIAVHNAESRGITTGDWVAEAFYYYAQSAKKNAAADVTIPSDKLPAIILPTDVSRLIDDRLTKFQQDFEEKLTALFRQTQEKPQRWWLWTRKVA